MFSVIVISILLQGQLEAVKESIKKMGKVEFAYEGDFKRLNDRPSTPVSPGTYKYSGSLKINTSTGLVVTEHRKPHVADFVVTKASFSPKRASYTSKLESRKTPLNQAVEAGGYLATTHIGGHYLYNWFPSASLLVANDQDAVSFDDLGDQLKGGRRCRLIAHRFRDVDEAKYWVDLERNGLVVASEFWREGVLLSVVTANDVRSFQAKGGRKVWLPTEIVREMFGRLNRETMKDEPTAEPWCRFTTRILPESVKIDDKDSKIEEHKPVDPFAIEKKPGPIAIR